MNDKRKRQRRTAALALPWEKRGQRWFSGRDIWRLPLLLIMLTLIGAFFYRHAALNNDKRITFARIRNVHRALEVFQGQMGRCPKTVTELVHPPRVTARYLREVPKDAWGKKFFIRCPGFLNPESVDVISAGPSGSFFDDDNLY